MTLTAADQTKCVQAATYLMGLGNPPLPRNGAVSIIAVLFRESRLNPGSQGHQPTETPGVLNPSGAYGIASWNGPRQAKLQAFCAAYNLPVDNLQSQLRFVLSEMANSYSRSWAAVRSDAVYTFIIPIIVAEYENPANIELESKDAKAIAAEFEPLVPIIDAAPPAQPPPLPPKPQPQPAPGPTTGLPTMDPVLEAFLTKIIGIVIQSVMSAVLQHLTAVIQTGGVPSVPAVPTQPGAVNWEQALQDIGKIISQATQPPTK